MPEQFIAGRVVYLRRPDLDKDVSEGEWHSWFNDPESTRYLTHGVRPVSRDEERAIIAAELDNPRSLLLSICECGTDRLLGVVSLKSIDHLNRSAEIAIVRGPHRVKHASLEAMALMTKHAFDRLNLGKLYAGQHEGLWRWVNALRCVGYRVEGFQEDYGYRDGQPYGAILTGITSARFYELQGRRGGNILPDPIDSVYQWRPQEDPAVALRAALREVNPDPFADGARY